MPRPIVILAINGVKWEVKVKMRAHWHHRPQYHQKIKSVFVGGRLSFLLPPPAGKFKTLLKTYDSKVRTQRLRNTGKTKE